MIKSADIFDVLRTDNSQKDSSNEDGRISVYYEALDCGCNLVIYSNEAYIEYNFSKYGKNCSRTHQYKVLIKDVDKYLKTLRANLDIYNNTIKDSDIKASVSFPGLGHMTININSKNPGVCIDRYYFPVSSEEQYKIYENDFLYAKNKAEEIINNTKR